MTELAVLFVADLKAGSIGISVFEGNVVVQGATTDLRGSPRSDVLAVPVVLYARALSRCDEGFPEWPWAIFNSFAFQAGQEWHFLLLGWVLMPAYFHVLIKPEPAATTPLIMKGLKEKSAKRIIQTLRENLQYPWCRNTLAKLRLPFTVHDESHYRLWQRRFYTFNVFSENKFQQKLDDMHNNPVARGLVSSPGDWPWSSWRFYYWQDASILRMDRMR